LLQQCIETENYYIQQSGGEDQFKHASGRYDPQKSAYHQKILDELTPNIDYEKLKLFFSKRGIVFFSALDWMEFSKRLDFSIGFRFHGAMASLGAGIPGIVISHDSRTSELTKFMGIPNIELKEGMGTKIDDILSRINFDSELFDIERKKSAKKLLDALKKNNILPSIHLMSLAN
jgi:hypothetical protein